MRPSKLTTLVGAIVFVAATTSACIEPPGSVELNEDAAELCDRRLDFSDEETGLETYDDIYEIAEWHEHDLGDLIDKMTEKCPESMSQYREWRDTQAWLGGDADEDYVPPPKPPKPDRGAQGDVMTRDECADLGVWVADQQAAGAFTDRDYNWWLRSINRCYRDARR